MKTKQLINVKDLNLKLRTLREEFQSARPLLAEEIRDFTYSKPTYAVASSGKIPSSTFKHTPVISWVMVTEPVKVKLRQYGIPRVEERINQICKEIREVKQQIFDLGEVAEGWDMVKSNKREEGYA